MSTKMDSSKRAASPPSCAELEVAKVIPMPHAEGDSSPVKSSDDESIQCSDVSEAGSDSHDSLSSQEGLEHELRSNDDKSIEENASKEVNTKPPETPQTLAKTEKKSDFATSLVEEEKDQSSPFEAKTANAGLTVTETPQRTGEEDEITKVALRARLFEYDVDSKDWKDRGPGLVKVNVEKESGKARLLMRADGILRVILNIRLFEGMDYSIPTERSIRFTAVVESRPTQFLLRCRSAEELCAVLVELDLYCSHYDEAIAEK